VEQKQQQRKIILFALGFFEMWFKSLSLPLLLSVACFLLATVEAKFVTMRQDSARNGYFDVIDSLSGEVVHHSSAEPIIFGWPYCEMTSDQLGQRAFAVIFPDNSNNSVLYELNRDLQVTHTYPNTPFWFFDLQYSPKEKSLYGIKVTSTYGRVVSQFQTPSEDSEPLIATELVTLPYMWYVNASTFDDVNNRYFALINYFPGHPESTLNQKLLISTMEGSEVPKDYTFFDMESSTSPQGILQFITYSKHSKELYFASVSQDLTTVFVGILCQKTAKVKTVLATFNAFSVGPLTVDDKEGVLTVFVKLHQGAAWTLYQVSMDGITTQPKALKTYSLDYFSVFDAVARF
jgi:hypothetical protein